MSLLLSHSNRIDKTEVQSQSRRLKAQNLRLDVVFHLAIALEDYQLVQQTCAPAIENKWHLDESYVSEVWRNRLVSHFSFSPTVYFTRPDVLPAVPVALFFPSTQTPAF